MDRLLDPVFCAYLALLPVLPPVLDLRPSPCQPRPHPAAPQWTGRGCLARARPCTWRSRCARPSQWARSAHSRRRYPWPRALLADWLQRGRWPQQWRPACRSLRREEGDIYTFTFVCICWLIHHMIIHEFVILFVIQIKLKLKHTRTGCCDRKDRHGKWEKEKGGLRKFNSN